MWIPEQKIVCVPDIIEEKMDLDSIVQDLDLENENLYGPFPGKGGRKRIMLQQLSWEEKLQRKKLRNRIAAQTSRDRKKAKMDHLEETVKELKQKNDMLFLEIEELKKKNEMLVNANSELQKTLSMRPYTCSCLRKSEEGGRKEIGQKSTLRKEEICAKDDHPFERPAESSIIPRQKGQWTPYSQTLNSSWGLWKIFLLFLISQKCWQNSRKTHCLMTLKEWQQICLKKLNSMREEEIQNLFSLRLQELADKNASSIMKWWGRHQKNWNPVEIN